MDTLRKSIKDFSILHARKEGDEGDKDNPSVRYIVKEEKESSFGEIFNVYAFEKLAKRFKINDCKVVNDHYIKRQKNLFI